MMRRILTTMTIAVCITGLTVIDDAGAAARKKPLTLKELERLIGQITAPKATPRKKGAKPRKGGSKKTTAKAASPAQSQQAAPVKPQPKPQIAKALEPPSAEAPVKPVPKPQIAEAAELPPPEAAVKPVPKPQIARAAELPLPDAPAKPVAKPAIVPPVISTEKPSQPDAQAPQREAGLSQPGPVDLPVFDGSQACLDDLKAMGVEFTVPAQLAKTGDCDVANPVQMTAVSSKGKRIAFPDKPVLRCSFAKTFASWTVDVAAPIVGKHAGSELAAMPTGPGFECRGRNGDSSSKTSEHGFGNAIDIESLLTEDKKRVSVQEVADESDPNYRLLQALRLSGCGYFTTVLGPGSNEAHARHFHFDLAQRGKNNNYKICE